MHPIILEFDPDRNAIIEPSMLHLLGRVPDSIVLCFFQECISKFVEEAGGRLVTHLHSEIGHSPVYEVTWNGRKVGIAHPGVGAPLCSATLEELIAMGGTRFIACGSAGVLAPGMPLGLVLVPYEAARDEGTSYQYLAPDEPARPSPAALERIRRFVSANGIEHREVKTWTTDAVYRETRGRMSARLALGCESVDMEASALFAVAQFRGVELGQIFYASDDLTGEEWDSRDFHNRHDARERLARIAMDIASLP